LTGIELPALTAFRVGSASIGEKKPVNANGAVSHASPMPSRSVSAWSELATSGQLSVASGTPSLSVSGGGGGAVLKLTLSTATGPGVPVTRTMATFAMVSASSCAVGGPAGLAAQPDGQVSAAVVMSRVTVCQSPVPAVNPHPSSRMVGTRLKIAQPSDTPEALKSNCTCPPSAADWSPRNFPGATSEFVALEMKHRRPQTAGASLGTVRSSPL
jgi:hypothetical protein